MTALLLLAAVLPAPGGALPIRPGTYVPRGEACRAAGRESLRYDRRVLRDAEGRPVRREVRVHGPEGFTLGVRGRGGRTFLYCRPDEVPTERGRHVAAKLRRRT